METQTLKKSLFSLFTVAFLVGGFFAIFAPISLPPTNGNGALNTASALVCCPECGGMCGYGSCVTICEGGGESYPGECGAALNECYVGDWVDYTDDATYYKWRCLLDLYSPVCTYPKSTIVNGVCNNTVRDGCTTGTYAGDDVDQGTYWTWSCNGSGGGTNSGTCSMNKPPVAGVCGATAYNCSVGTSINNVAGSSAYTWNCAGLYGGATSPQCSQPNLKWQVEDYDPGLAAACVQVHTCYTAGDDCSGYGEGYSEWCAPCDFWEAQNGVYVIPGNYVCTASGPSPVQGECKNGYLNECYVGGPINQAVNSPSSNYTWNCTGLNGGATSVQCYKTKAACNLPWGGTIASGASVTAYSAAGVGCGTACYSETRSCNDGVLSGSYTSQSCTASTRTAYAPATSACGTYSYYSEGQTCQTNGAWTGSYSLTTPPAASTRTGKLTSAVACGSACSDQAQTCQSNGLWSGSGSATCTASSRTMYAPLTSSCGTYSSASEGQTCQTNGVWTGSYTLGSAPAASTRVGYNPSSSACGIYSCADYATDTCLAGGWSGNHSVGSCTIASRTGQQVSAVACGTSCPGSETQYCQSGGGWGGSGSLTCTASARTRYAALTSSCGTYSSTSEGQTCQTNGVWTGTYTLASAPAASTRTGYNPGSSACGIYSCADYGTDTCLVGGWNGAHSSPSCTVASRTGQQVSAVACGTSCPGSETQYCQAGGVWGGSGSLTCTATTRTRYTSLSSSCGIYSSPSEVQSCQTNGVWTGSYALTTPATIATRTGYQASSVSCGSSCTGEAQTCLVGGWSGTYTNASCVVNPLNAVCSATHYGCTPGTLGTNSYTAAGGYTWVCNGSCGGTNQLSCAEPVVPVLSTPTVSAISSTGATLGATVTANGGGAITARGTCWGTTAAPTGNCVAEGGTAIAAFSHARGSMTAGTVIYYRGYADNSAGRGYSSDGSFTTLNVPTLSSPTVSGINAGNATLGANVTSNGGAALTARGTCWGTTAAPTTNCVADGSTATGVFTQARSSITAGTTIYYRGYATNSVGTAYSADGTFSVPSAPVVNPNPDTANAGQVRSYTFTGTDPSGATLAYEVDWDNITGTIEETWPSASTYVTSGTQQGSSNSWASGGTKYFNVRIKTSTGKYSAWTLVTVSVIPIVPTVTTPTSASVAMTTATLGGTVTSNGGAALTARGTCWATTAAPAINCVAEGGTSVAAFTHGRTALPAGTLIYYRAYATNSAGTGYSADGTFTTLNIPTVTTPTSASITSTGATLGATVTANGGAALTARGTCWGTTAAPVTNCTAEGGTAVSAYTHARTGMTAGTLIYYRGYATNSAGTAYSADGTFTTLALPTLTTPTVSGINAGNATLGATVTSNGGAALTARGTCWGTTAAPTGNCTAEGGTAVAAFTQARTSITCGSTIYYRGYATNSVGTAYSADGTFSVPCAPTITPNPDTANVSQARPYALQGTDLSANIAYQVDWDNVTGTIEETWPTASTYVTSNTVQNTSNSWAGSGVKVFNVRTKTQDGRYSAWRSATTTVSGPPAISSPTHTAVTTTGATLGGNITSNGGSALTARGTCWGTSAAPATNCTNDGSTATGIFTQIRSGMTVGTTYFYRAYATNGVGTTYTTDGTFGTLCNGSCNTTHYNCLSTCLPASATTSGPTTWTWACNGLNGGTNATGCSETKPAPNAPTITGATQGMATTSYAFDLQASNPSGDNIRYAIDSDNNGSADVWLPGAGYVAQNTIQTWNNNWGGRGVKTFKVRTETNGGPSSGWTTHNITIYEVPVVTWLPGATTNIPYNGTINMGYSSTDSVSCSYYDVDFATGNTELATIWLAGATTSSWTNTGPYTTSFRRKVVCIDPFGRTGRGDISATVLQNGATCVSANASKYYLYPGEAFTGTVTMTNPNTNPWVKTGMPHFVSSTSSVWTYNTIDLDTAPVNQGGTGTFTRGLFAPAGEGLYDYIWSLKQQINATNTVAIGTPCAPNPVTPHAGNQILVKRPTLSVNTDTLFFPPAVLGDPVASSSITISNTGGGTLVGSISGVGGDFACSPNCTFSVGAGSSVTKYFTYTPASSSTVTQNVTITVPMVPDVPPGTGVNLQNAPLSLTGSAMNKIDVSAPSLNFGDVPATKAKMLNITFENNSLTQGAGTVNLTTALTNAGASPTFTCVSNCSFTLGAQGSQTARIKFLPSSADQDYDYPLVLSTLDPSTTIHVIGKSIKPEFKVREQ